VFIEQLLPLSSVRDVSAVLGALAWLTKVRRALVWGRLVR